MLFSLNSAEVISPKRTIDNPTNRLAWHDYYAGYSPEFAHSFLKSITISKDAVVLDPWNGAGTTTLAASALGIKSKGFDLNPAPIVIAKAFRISYGDKQSILPLLDKIVAKSIRISLNTENDPLGVWFDEKSANYLRRIEQSIQHFLVPAKRGQYILNNTTILSDIASFFYLALFKTVRSLLTKFVGSNPTWIKTPKNIDDRVAHQTNYIKSIFTDQINAMVCNFAPIFNSSTNVEPDLELGNSTLIPCTDNTVDIVFTSPPYCTRIDYAVYTMPELSILGFTSEQFDKLRRQLIGTTTVPKSKPNVNEIWGPSCKMLLQKIESHTAISSNSYYLKNHLQYFDLMSKSLFEINRVLKPNGVCTLVVQDSYYKDIHNNLPLIMSEMAENIGWSINSKHDFTSPNNMADVNSKSRKYKERSKAIESVLIFEKK